MRGNEGKGEVEEIVQEEIRALPEAREHVHRHPDDHRIFDGLVDVGDARGAGLLVPGHDIVVADVPRNNSLECEQLDGETEGDSEEHGDEEKRALFHAPPDPGKYKKIAHSEKAWILTRRSGRCAGGSQEEKSRHTRRSPSPWEQRHIEEWGKP